MELSAPEDGITRLDLSHSAVPEDDRYGNHYIPKRVKKGWEDAWFGMIQKVLGYAKVEKKEL